MKKLLALLLISVLSISMLAGCGATTEEATTETTTTEATETTTEEATTEEAATSGLSGSVALGGSTSVESVILSAIEVFTAENPDVTITYDPTGSSAGVTGALDGSIDIGLASRDVKDSEMGEGAIGTVFAIDGIAVVVHPDNAVADLSLENITNIANGTITNWSEVGGADAPIVLIGREAGSGTRDGFESIVDVEAPVYEQELPSTGGVIGAVAGNPNAIGYASISAVDEKVKALTVDGVEATEANVQDGSYVVQRNFNFVTVEGTELSAQAQAFFDYVLSADAAQLISDAGAVAPAA